jgi:hypothetical protein
MSSKEHHTQQFAGRERSDRVFELPGERSLILSRAASLRSRGLKRVFSGVEPNRSHATLRTTVQKVLHGVAISP